jgi:hypothetical protein
MTLRARMENHISIWLFRQKKARHGGAVRAHGRCNFASHVSTPARSMFANRAGWRQVCRAVRCIRSGGCGFARHGTYARVSPPGTLIARWYCPEGRRTFSLLPDWFAARLTGGLCEVEAVVRGAEQAPSREAACAGLRLDIELPGALRWMGRRVQSVHSALHLLKGLLPERFSGCEPTLTAFGERLGSPTCWWLARDRRGLSPDVAETARIPPPAPAGGRPPWRAPTLVWGRTRRGAGVGSHGQAMGLRHAETRR